MKLVVAGAVVFLFFSLQARNSPGEPHPGGPAVPIRPPANSMIAQDPGSWQDSGDLLTGSASGDLLTGSASGDLITGPASGDLLTGSASGAGTTPHAGDTTVSITAPGYHAGDTICVIGTGDIMLGTDYPSRTYLPPGEDCSPLLRPVHEVLQSGDLLFGNLEGVFCSEGGTPKYCRDTTKCYVFRMPDHFVDCLVEAGYDVMSVANNHVNDFGPRGRITTAGVLTEAGIAFAGFTTHPWTVFRKGGVTYGFAAFSPHTGTMNLKDYGQAARITRMLDSIADIVIISFHGGAEGNQHQHVIRGDEEYLGYNRGNSYLFAHTVVDAGADVVFGHGPHVTRAMELYRGRMIFYSLGNFCTYRRFNLRGPNGIAPIVKVRMDRRGNFISGEVIPVIQPGEGGPRIDPAKRVIHTMRMLTETDFPDQSLAFSADGSIVRLVEIRPVKLPEELFAGGIRWETDDQWVPGRLEMIWTHFLGQTVPAGQRSEGNWNRLGWTNRPLLAGDGKDTFLIQCFDHRIKKLDLFTGRELSGKDALKAADQVWTEPEVLEAIPAGLYEGHKNYRMAAYVDGDGFLRVVQIDRPGPGPGSATGASTADSERLTAWPDNITAVMDSLAVMPGAPDSVPDPVSDPVSDPVPDPVSDPVPDPVSDPVSDPLCDPAPDLVPDPVPDPHGPSRSEVFSWNVGHSASTPLITGKRMVVCSDRGIYLFGYDRNMNFTLLDRLPVPVEVTPVLYEGRLYVASLNGYLYCLGEKD
ncbi:MAG: CapA family protein [Bacteroidota bacterium]